MTGKLILSVTCDTWAPFDPAGAVAMKLAHDVTLVQVSQRLAQKPFVPRGPLRSSASSVNAEPSGVATKFPAIRDRLGS